METSTEWRRDWEWVKEGVQKSDELQKKDETVYWKVALRVERLNLYIVTDESFFVLYLGVVRSPLNT